MEPSSSFFIQNMISETNKSKLLQIANRLPIIEKIADRLPGWKADLLTKAGRNILVQSVLTSMLIYLLLALWTSLPRHWKQLTKLEGVFFGKEEKM